MLGSVFYLAQRETALAPSKMQFRESVIFLRGLTKLFSRIGETPVSAEGDRRAAGVDLAGPFPVLAHGGVVQPGVVRRHLRGIVFYMRVIQGQ